MLNSPFFIQFLKLSNIFTIAAIVALIAVLVVLQQLKKRKVSFSVRMMIALVLGLALGIGIDLIGASNSLYIEYARKEISTWYGLLGNGFLRFVQLLAVPVVFLSIIKVVTDLKGDNIKSLTWKSFFMLLGTTAIAALVGIAVVYLFNLGGSSLAADLSEAKMESMANIAAQSFPEFFLNLIPNNIFASFASNSSIVSVVIIAALFASAIRFLKVKKPEQIAPFVDVLESLRVAVNSVLTNVIKFMPYGVVALVSNTIIQNGIASIIGMLSFIGALYVAVIIMLVVYVIILLGFGINPIQFYKKAFPTMLFAFSSRSSVGALPYTLKTLGNEMGVSGQTANFVATLGTTIGMNGCAGIFPAMLGVIVAAATGVEMNFAFFVLVVLVVTIGSIGIAGVPGTATVAATVTLNGLGLGNAIASIGGVFGIDPIVDMGRTMINVTGSMVSAAVVDKWNGNMDMDAFNAPVVHTNEEEA